MNHIQSEYRTVNYIDYFHLFHFSSPLFLLQKPRPSSRGFCILWENGRLLTPNAPNFYAYRLHTCMDTVGEGLVSSVTWYTPV